jgi:F-type H+-transporting ATPase subunit delta
MQITNREKAKMTEVCKEYGGGLYLLACESDLESVFFEQLMMIKGILEENPAYVKLLSSPSLSSGEKRELVRKAFEGKTHEYIISFMLLLCDRGYFAYMNGCVDVFKKMYFEKCNISEGIVKSAYALCEKEKEKIQNALTSKFGGKKLMLTYIVDESLLGGFIAEIDGYVVDSTLKTKLGGLKDVLSKPI